MSDNTVDFSQNKAPLDYASIKDSLNTEKKTWWNTRSGYIIKTTYDPSNRSYHEQNLPFNLIPEGKPITFESNVINEQTPSSHNES
jgi:hypothetical protein